MQCFIRGDACIGRDGTYAHTIRRCSRSIFFWIEDAEKTEQKWDQFPTHATVPRSQLFLFQSYFLRCLWTSEHNDWRTKEKFECEIFRLFITEHIKIVCMRHAYVQSSTARWWIPMLAMGRSGNFGIRYENTRYTRQHGWDANSYPNKFTDVWIRETATEFAQSIGTCVIIMCHWN